MKKNILVCGLIASLFTSSCKEDFLDVESASSLYVNEYYTTQSRIFEALTSAYDPLKWVDYAWGQYAQPGFVSDLMGDDVYKGGSDQNDALYLGRIANYEALPTSVNSDFWTICYSGINRSNVMLENIDNVKDIDAITKAQYIAEAKVLRTYYYSWLWKFWGNIPYYEKNLEYPYVAQQLKADDVYAKMVACLEDAIKNGSLPMKQSDEWCGRITQATAYMLYTEIVMYQKDNSRYSTALDYMKEIIGSKKYSLMSDFSAIWEKSGEWCDESIFEINYTSTNGVRSWSNAIATGGTVYPKLIGINGLKASNEFTGGWGFEPVRQEAYDMYEATDQRRDGGILNFEHYKLQNPDASYEPRYEDTGNFLKKYIARANGNAGYSADADLNYDNNYRIYRYAETLLNAAELAQRIGDASAQTYLDEIRDRAGVEHITATLDNIIQERHLEFVGEGKRYWDLVRTDKATSVLVPNTYRTNTWSESKKYLPIPQSEIDSDNNLQQNAY